MLVAINNGDLRPFNQQEDNRSHDNVTITEDQVMETDEPEDGEEDNLEKEEAMEKAKDSGFLSILYFSLSVQTFLSVPLFLGNRDPVCLDIAHTTLKICSDM